jgi:hypothetical protein
MAPGRASPVPPPTSDANEALWCGQISGGVDSSGAEGESRPATEWIPVTSRACSPDSSGSSPTSRWASMVLPVPGGPVSSTWWPPAAATSSPQRASGCPTTSARSGTGGGSTAAGSPARTSVDVLPRSQASTSHSRWAPSTSTPVTSAASASVGTGTTALRKPARRAASRAGSTPGTARSRPSRASSPSSTVLRSRPPAGTARSAASTAQARARS